MNTGTAQGPSFFGERKREVLVVCGGGQAGARVPTRGQGRAWALRPLLGSGVPVLRSHDKAGDRRAPEPADPHHPGPQREGTHQGLVLVPTGTGTYREAHLE